MPLKIYFFFLTFSFQCDYELRCLIFWLTKLQLASLLLCSGATSRGAALYVILPQNPCDPH